eukprot:8985393-Pyramimonas_sp.AAC.1
MWSAAPLQEPRSRRPKAFDFSSTVDSRRLSTLTVNGRPTVDSRACSPTQVVKLSHRKGAFLQREKPQERGASVASTHQETKEAATPGKQGEGEENEPPHVHSGWEEVKESGSLDTDEATATPAGKPARLVRLAY